ncbi:hypothetical protein DVH05_006387 [Phytophthora capsici]|nr:hypothetical protein DVH05_006387 [Phytophthora capsici]
MSSPHEPQVGLALQRAAKDTAWSSNNTRPFSATDSSGEDLLTVLVHFGRHLDVLVPKEDLTGLDSPNSTSTHGEQLNTYVVASVGSFASSDLVQCFRGSKATSTSASEGRVLYEQNCSPYTATRVVEGSASPTWNEVLAIPLPPGWSELHDQGDRNGSRTGDDQTNARLALKLELVERGASHQEDFLLGTCVLPLAKTGCQVQQMRFTLAFPTPDTSNALPSTSPASVYVSLHTTSRSRSSINSQEQVEITVECFTPVVITGSEDEATSLDCTSLTALVNLHIDGSTNSAISEPTEKVAVLEKCFTFLQDGQALPGFNVAAVNMPRMEPRRIGITPSSSSTTGSASGVYEWFFPINFALQAESNYDISASTVDIALFKTSSMDHSLVGRGQLHLSSTGARKDGSLLRHTVIPITHDNRVLGHIALRVRWWDAPGWSDFVDGTPTRRVICTNRWKRSPRPTIAWMGAILRGLNRHPVASICDAGGVSGIVAELLAKPPPSEEVKQKQQPTHLQQQNLVPRICSTGDANGITDLLRKQLTHLQDEGTAQRLQIERLHSELDTRLAAIKTCGVEIVALRRKVRQKDEELQKLKEHVEVARRREQEQVDELLASTNINGVAFPVSLEHQAASQRFTLLAAKYKELDHDYQTVKQQFADAQQSLDLYTDLEARHGKLQEAHLVQSALVQRLQRDKQHAATLQKAVRVQEKVIRQFEQTVAQQSTKIPDRPARDQHLPGAETPETNGEGTETQEALLRVRVQVLEKQLQTNAREAAAEISSLRLRILELEAAQIRRTGK